MLEFHITWFSDNDSSSGVPNIIIIKGRDEQEAIVQFKYMYPTKDIWSIDSEE